MKLEFIKNIIDVDVDGARGINHYVINAMYDEIDADGYANIIFKLVTEFDLTWDEIKKKGGIDEVTKQLKEQYRA